MNLIRNTLLVIVFLQLLGFLYVKILYQEERIKTLSTELKPLQPIVTLKTKKLPLSTEYTDSKKTSLIEMANISKEIEAQVIVLQAIIPKLSLNEIKEMPKPIQKVYVKRVKKVKLTSKIEKYAKKMLGKKYVWGGIGPKNYDCSGFTQKVYRKVAGITLPRVSYLQAKVGKKIAFKQLKQGDMVFFDTQKKRTGRVNHVGIYLTNGNFIHASSGGKKVMITNFRKKRFYKNRFLWGRRVLKEQKNIAMLINNR